VGSEFFLDIFEDENDFQMYLANPNFKAPGEKIDEYTANGNTYIVYKSSLADAETVALVDRLQVLILFFIEGGSYIDTSDDRWQIYILYVPPPPCQMHY
jgi:histone acetyltransferase 1